MAGRKIDSYSGLQISSERIAAMRDDELSSLFKDLLRAHAYKAGVHADAAYVNTEEKAKDDGCDAWAGPATSPDRWLGPEGVCWQLKAGEAGEPSRLRNEVKKRIPQATLASGGRFVVVTSSSSNGKKGQDDRRKVLETEAKGLGLPIEKIDVIGSERLAEWCNEHPAIAWRFAGHTASVVPLNRWATTEQHRVQWRATDQAEASIKLAQQDLDLNSGRILHLHIEGPPGVGKTRFALELCKGAPWATDVVYVRQAAEVDVGSIVQVIADCPGARLVIVADEVQQHQLMALRDTVAYSGGRVRLVTIGHSRTPDPDLIPSISIAPLDDSQMSELVSAWHVGMPQEHVEFIVRFADGYVRLAQLAASAVAKKPTGSVRDLLDQEHIRQFFDRMLGTGDRRALYVVAALSTVGWEGDVAAEGKAVAAHLGMDWSYVQTEVEAIDRRLGIAPRGGRRRYISPTPLAAHLAVEAWAAMPGVMRSLPSALPSDEARDAYFERIKTIATTPFAREFAVEDLRTFFELAAFRTESDVKRWVALSAAAPLVAANGALNALQAESVEIRREVSGPSRRYLLTGLMSLASRSETFREAAISVALLAEAENEVYSNNATGEFLSLFQLRLGGTSAPYEARVRVAEELLAVGRDPLTRLVVSALGKAAETDEMRIRSLASFGQVAELEWRPKSHVEYVECIKLALSLIERAVPLSGAAEAAALKVVPDFARLLWMDGIRSPILSFFDGLAKKSSEAQKLISRTLARYLHNEEKYWKRLSPASLAEISGVLVSITPADMSSRLEREVGTSSWDKATNFDFGPLASEFVARPQQLRESIAWLTSGEAADAWRFGEAVGEAADLSSLVDSLRSCEDIFGPDLRFVLAVIGRARAKIGESWFRSWIVGSNLRSSRHVDLVLESIWRIGPVGESVRLAGMSLKSASRNSVLGLGFGVWYEQVESDDLAWFLGQVAELGEDQVVLSIVDSATRARSADKSLGVLVSKMLESVELLRSKGTMVEYHWKELALRYLDSHADAILGTILRAHAARDGQSWFVKHSQVKEVLEQIAERFPEKFWAEIRKYLESPDHRGLFSIGFPEGLFDSVPYSEIKDWVEGSRDDRAGLMIRLIGADFSEQSHSLRLLNDFGGGGRIDDSLFSAYVSGGWSGPASNHWYELAESLDRECQGREGYFLVWAKNAAQSLRAMGDRDRMREEEDDAVWRNR